MSPVSIIIVSYNTKKLTAAAITSALGAGEIIVVDNDSRDGSPEYLHNIFGKKITILKQYSNGGFAKANNIGIKATKSEYVLLLNSDTIVHDHAIETMVTALQAHPEFGIVSCTLLNADGTYQPQGGALPTLLNLIAWWLWPLPGIIPGIDPYQSMDEPHLPDRHQESSPRVERMGIEVRGWVGGTAMLIRRETLEKIGLLDERIFMYAEDIDLCLRARAAGYKVGMIQSAQITHLGSKSAGSHSALVGEIRGLIYLWKKHFPAWQTPLLRLVFIKGALLRYLLFGILQGDGKARTLYAQILRVSLRGSNPSQK